MLFDGRFVLQEVSGYGVHPETAGRTSLYERAQGRVLASLELWALARGHDVRGDEGAAQSVGKLYGMYLPSDVVGPDPLYKMIMLKDVSKANKDNRPEIIGVARHRDPLLCGINATATMLLLRFGAGGLIGKLPDFFDIKCRCCDAMLPLLPVM